VNGSLQMPDPSPSSPWLVATVQHEGAPLALRVRAGADTPAHRARYPRLAIIVHTMTKVGSNGLPESAYNETLADFDADVFDTVEKDGRAIVVIVETFQGERSYYAYASVAGVSKAATAELAERHPDQQLQAFGSSDPDWALFNDYRARWPW
jgi:hypothetical protein